MQEYEEYSSVLAETAPANAYLHAELQGLQSPNATAGATSCASSIAEILR